MELFSEMFEAEERNLIKLKEVVFAIFYQDENIVKQWGNGVIISSSGIFITVGHIFRKMGEKVDLSKCRIYQKINNEDKFYKIKSLSYYNSKEIYLQRKPVYTDLAIGQIEEYSPSSYAIFDRRKLKVENKLRAVAYMRLRPEENNCFGKNIDHIEYLENLKICVSDISFLDNNALISDLESDYKKRNSERIFNNCATLRLGTKHCAMLRLNPKLGRTASGCPIVDEKNNIRGLLIGGCPVYYETHIVKSKYCSKMIQHKTEYLYSAFEYLKNKDK